MTISIRKWVVSIFLAALIGWMLGAVSAPDYFNYAAALALVGFVLIA